MSSWFKSGKSPMLVSAPEKIKVPICGSRCMEKEHNLWTSLFTWLNHYREHKMCVCICGVVIAIEGGDILWFNLKLERGRKWKERVDLWLESFRQAVPSLSLTQVPVVRHHKPEDGLHIKFYYALLYSSWLSHCFPHLTTPDCTVIFYLNNSYKGLVASPLPIVNYLFQSGLF